MSLSVLPSPLLLRCTHLLQIENLLQIESENCNLNSKPVPGIRLRCQQVNPFPPKARASQVRGDEHCLRQLHGKDELPHRQAP